MLTKLTVRIEREIAGRTVILPGRCTKCRIVRPLTEVPLWFGLAGCCQNIFLQFYSFTDGGQIIVLQSTHTFLHFSLIIWQILHYYEICQAFTYFMIFPIEMHVHLSLTRSPDFAEITIKFIKIWISGGWAWSHHQGLFFLDILELWTNLNGGLTFRIRTKLILSLYLQHHSDLIFAIGSFLYYKSWSWLQLRYSRVFSNGFCQVCVDLTGFLT